MYFSYSHFYQLLIIINLICRELSQIFLTYFYGPVIISTKMDYIYINVYKIYGQTIKVITSEYTIDDLHQDRMPNYQKQEEVQHYDAVRYNKDENDAYPDC